MTPVTAQELLILDEKRFDKEYWAWTQYAADHDWWDFIYDDFKATCATKGVSVSDMTFSGFWSQGDGAAFAGHVCIPTFMEQQGLDEKYPALYIAAKNDGSYVRVRFTRGNNMQCADYAMCGNQTEPAGVFDGLDQEAWEALVDEQDGDANLEKDIMEFCEDLAHDLYTALEAEHDHLTSKESFLESCEYNEITFEIETEETT